MTSENNGLPTSRAELVLLEDSTTDGSDANLQSTNHERSLLEAESDDAQRSISVHEVSAPIIEEGRLLRQDLVAVVKNTTTSNSNELNQDHAIITSIVDLGLNTPSVEDGEACLYVAPTPVAATTVSDLHQTQKKKHIMISYNRASAGTIARKIYERLEERGYRVWFDDTDLHDNVYSSMGDGLDNCYLLLSLINLEYSESRFAMLEIEYAHQNKTRIIPCLVSDGFCPTGGLGLIMRSLKQIKFFHDDQFDESFEEVIREIEFAERRIEQQSATGNNTNASFGDQFKKIISEHTAEMGQNSSPLRRNVTDDVFYRILSELIQEFCPELLDSFQNNVTHGLSQGNPSATDRVLQHLIEQDDRLIEHVRTLEGNDARNREHLLGLNERLAAFDRFQRAQEAANLSVTEQRSRQEESLRSFVRLQTAEEEHIPSLNLQLNNRNEQLVHLNRRLQEQEYVSQRLEQQVQQLIGLTITQQQIYARNIEISNQSSRQNMTSLDVLNKLIQTIVLLLILIALLRPDRTLDEE